MSNNIHPIFDSIIGRKSKEAKLKQQSKVFWFTGLSGSGKSTIAENFEKKLFENGYFTQVLDGDNIRSGINADLGFSINDREENIRRIAEIAKLYLNSGIITIVSFISPTIASREAAKAIIGQGDFIEIYINTPIEICEKRDVKGLYKKARNGEIKDFSGINSPYEEPENPSLEIKTESIDINQSVNKLFNFANPLIKHI